MTPKIAIQDSLLINYANGALPNNLTAITETRDAAGCNGCLSGGDCGSVGASCYSNGDGTYSNGRTWNGNSELTRGTWHFVEVYLRMNSISGNKGQADGIMWMKVNGNYVINKSNIVYRTNQNPTKKWREFVIAPWIGDGSPQAQTMWMDELVMADNPPNGGPPEAPQNVRIIP